MALKNISEGGNFELPEPGLYPMIITGVIDVGLQQSVFGTKPKVYITMELVGPAMSDGRPFVLTKPFTISLHKQGSLLPFLEALRGKSFTQEERKAFDLTRIAGKPGRVVVNHQTSEQGKTFANIASVLPPEKGAPTTSVNEVLVFDSDAPDQVVFGKLPEWLQNKITSAVKVEKPQPATATPTVDFDDDLSF